MLPQKLHINTFQTLLFDSATLAQQVSEKKKSPNMYGPHYENTPIQIY